MARAKNPLTGEQESLRGRKIKDMSDDQLRLWIDACDRMEHWVGFAKARRTWKRSRSAAAEELASRTQRRTRRASPLD
jgi:hypothetical protein